MIDDFGAALLVKLRKDEPRLAQIIAMENKITMAGAQMVADAVTADKDLAYINIENGPWDSSGQEAKAEALKEVFNKQNKGVAVQPWARSAPVRGF